MNMRPVLPDDLPNIEAKLGALQAKNPLKQMVHSDLPTAMAHITQAAIDHRCYIVDDTFFILFDVGTVWYTKKPFLLEQLVLRISSNNFHVGNAIDALTELAKFHGCTTVVVGDTQVGVMTPHYLAEGYQFLGTQLIKEI